MAEMAPTERLYFYDTALSECTAVIAHVEELEAAEEKKEEDEEQGEERQRRYAVVLDRSVMHPQGGGQPSDTGTITIDSCVFTVFHVETDTATRQIIRHLGYVTAGKSESLKEGAAVNVQIDMDARMCHARLHSAGHLLDAAMRCAGREDLVPTKGYHFPDGNAYVEYDGNVAAEEREILAQALTVKAQELVDAGTAVEVNVEASDDGGGVLRTVTVADTPCPCGGTHVKNTKDIESITVTRIKKNKKAVRVYYCVGLKSKPN